ncbi:MAG: DUF3465 domain-containing protein [Propionibacteriaceae bacterium]|jgi:hypothetical protein|nr:DUF3465 domain-containing protein [Propionibacteriaceae bacterium]
MSSTSKPKVLSTATLVVIALVIGFVLGWYAAGMRESDVLPGDVTTSSNVSQSSASATPPVSSAPSAPATESASSSADSDDYLAQLYAEERSDVQVEGSGTVSRILADDTDGSAHQRFILELDSGQTLLVAHNIDLAPRLDGLKVGDRVGFYGEYVYTEQGGTIHWTHRPSSGTHVAGWLEWNGKKYS